MVLLSTGTYCTCLLIRFFFFWGGGGVFGKCGAKSFYFGKRFWQLSLLSDGIKFFVKAT